MLNIKPGKSGNIARKSLIPKKMPLQCAMANVACEWTKKPNKPKKKTLEDITYVDLARNLLAFFV